MLQLARSIIPEEEISSWVPHVCLTELHLTLSVELHAIYNVQWNSIKTSPSLTGSPEKLSTWYKTCSFQRIKVRNWTVGVQISKKIPRRTFVTQLFPIAKSALKLISVIFFNWLNQPNAANSQVYYLSFKYSSTCFEHPHTRHQELQQLQ